MNGPQPLSYADMTAWAGQTGNVVRREEWAILRDMDAAYLSAATDKPRDDRPGQMGGPPKPSGRLLSPELFDSLF